LCEEKEVGKAKKELYLPEGGRRKLSDGSSKKKQKRGHSKRPCRLRFGVQTQKTEQDWRLLVGDIKRGETFALEFNAVAAPQKIVNYAVVSFTKGGISSTIMERL